MAFNYQDVTIGDKTFKADYANDPNNAAEIQAQLLKGGDVTTTKANGQTFDNVTNQQTNGYNAPLMPPPQAPSVFKPQTYTPPTETTTPQVAVSQEIYNPANDINALAEARKTSAMAGLKSANDQNLSDLSAANGKIEPAYYNQRNATSTNSQQSSKNFAEYMAQRGLNNANGASGSMAQSNISNNVALQGNLGSLATGEAGVYADNAKQVADTNVAYNNDIASTNAGIEADSMQSLIAAQQQYNAQKLAQANTAWDQTNTVNNQIQNQANTNWQNQNTVNNQNQQQSNTVWSQNDLTNQHAIDQANTNWNNTNTVNNQNQNQYNYTNETAYNHGRDTTNDTNLANETAYNHGRDTTNDTNLANETAYNHSQDTIANTGVMADGTLTVAGKTAEANIKSMDANTAGQIISNSYAGQIAQGTINAQTASTAYQTMVNANYPQEEALKISGMIGQNTSVTLSNDAQTLANKYYPQIQQGIIDGNKLQNAYQSLVNGGYNASQAADIALKYAQVAGTNASTSGQNIDNYATSFSGGGAVTSGTVPAAYVNDVNAAAKQYGLDPSILAGLIQTESSWNPNAKNSSSGASGLGQFLPSTAKEQGVNTSDAKSSIYGAAKYLALRIQQAGSVAGGIMGYGEGTTAYLDKVMGAAKAIGASTAATAKSTAATDKAMAPQNAIDAYDSLSTLSDKNDFLNTYKTQIITQAGQATYTKLVADWSKAYKAEVAKTSDVYSSDNMKNLQ